MLTALKNTINWFAVWPLPRAFRRFHGFFWNSAPCERKERVKKKRQPSHAECGEHTFPIQCFGLVWAESHGNRARRGEKSARRLAELHPSGIHAQTLQSHDKNNIPHLSDGLQGIPVKMEAFSHRSIPHRIETICCCSQILLQVHSAGWGRTHGAFAQPPLCVCPRQWQRPWTILRMVWKWCAITSLLRTLAACLQVSKLTPGSQEVKFHLVKLDLQKSLFILASCTTAFILCQPLFQTQTNQCKSRSYDNVGILYFQHVQLSFSILSLCNLSPFNSRHGSGSTSHAWDVTLHDVCLPLFGRSRKAYCQPFCNTIFLLSHIRCALCASFGKKLNMFVLFVALCDTLTKIE